VCAQRTVGGGGGGEAYRWPAPGCRFAPCSLAQALPRGPGRPPSAHKEGGREDSTHKCAVVRQRVREAWPRLRTCAPFSSLSPPNPPPPPPPPPPIPYPPPPPPNPHPHPRAPAHLLQRRPHGGPRNVHGAGHAGGHAVAVSTPLVGPVGGHATGGRHAPQLPQQRLHAVRHVVRGLRQLVHSHAAVGVAVARGLSAQRVTHRGRHTLKERGRGTPQARGRGCQWCQGEGGVANGDTARRRRKVRCEQA
jgi:hypothetical protein